MKKQYLRLLCAVFAVLVCTSTALAAPELLIPGGCTVGIQMQTKGVVVTGFEEGSAAEAAGVKKGDIIIEADGKTVHTTETLKDSISKEDMVLTILRNGKEAEFCVTPKEKRLGAFVRDSVAGIGTLTYYDPMSGAFGALGHGVNDANSSQLIPVEEGVVVSSSVAEIVRGKNGTPGELKGRFALTSPIGSVKKNCDHGIFGSLNGPLAGKPLPVAAVDEIRTGRASILSNVSGTDVRAYTVEIIKLYPHADTTGRNLLLKVTDKDLLAATGGIVQGMSGSPIIQDGKLIGAVTHVLVNDPTRGYGIFIENMLDEAA